MRTINYTVSYEKLISRLPAMFAYLNIDEQGTCEIVKATEGEQGDYGKIIANIKIGFGFEHTCKDGTELKLSEGTKTYRTLIDTYYKAINDKEWERKEDGTYSNEFLAFIERGIGLKYVGLSEEYVKNGSCGVPIMEQFPLAPDYIYLGEAKTLYDKMIQMRKKLELWGNHTKICKDNKLFYQNLQEEYEMSNGDKLIEKLEELIAEADDVAEEYLGYAKDAKKELSLDFNINLTNTIKDLGMVTPYIQEWEAGKRYYEGDVVYHVDSNGYGMTWTCVNGELDTDEFGRKYTEGFYEEETELIFFDNGDKITIGGEEKETPTNWKPQSLNWTKDARYNSKEESIVVKGSCNSHLTSLRRYETYMNYYDEVETPDNYKDWLWFYRKGMVMNREEKYDEFGNLAVMYGKDEGHYDGIEAIYNEGEKVGVNVKEDNGYVMNLAAWGDVITDITAKNDNKSGIGTITFTYWIGVHLKAQKDVKNGIWYSIDDDLNYKYYFKNFEPDIDSAYGKCQGVKYTENYIYNKGSELWDLVAKGYFDGYVSGIYDKDHKPTEQVTEGQNYYKLYEKFEFDTSNNLQVYKINIGNRIKGVPYLITNFEATIDVTHVNVEERPLIRYDYYNGVNFQPSVNEDVYVERGVTQAFEKHLKFGEIKTLEDLENYANGGFFVISKEDIDLG